jgi:RNA polymerase sigma-70 factor (family 1)
MIISKNNKEVDKLLLQQIKADSVAAFDTLYDKYWEAVYRAAYKRLNDSDYAKDVTQDIFLHLWNKRAELEIDNFAPYLFTAVRNNVFKWMEKQKKVTPISELISELKETKEQADAEILRKEFIVKYEALVGTLTPAQQKIFRMRFHEDLSTKEISEQLNISRKTVQNQLAKSILQLRSSFEVLYFVMMFHFYK